MREKDEEEDEEEEEEATEGRGRVYMGRGANAWSTIRRQMKHTRICKYS